MQRSKSRNLDVVHSGVVLWQELGGKGGREKTARLVLTKDQLTVQVQAGEEATTVSGITQADSMDMSIRTVNVPKTKDGLGLSIKGGSDGTHHVPIVISKVLPNLSAALTGQVFVGDLIIEVNGVSLDGKTHEEVVTKLREAAGPHITLTLKRDSQVSPLLQPAGSRLSIPNIVDFSFKSALKTPAVDRQLQEDEFDSDAWKTVIRLPLPMAIVSRYLWGTDRLRSSAFEVRSVDGRSSGIIDCEDRKALEQWVQYIDSHISTLNKKSIRMSNKYLHASEKISYIGWVDERMPDGYFEDPKVKWEQRFVILKGPDLCIFQSPPLNAEELDKCVSTYKVYETALKTAAKRVDKREYAFCVDTAGGVMHYMSLQSKEQLQQFEAAYYNALYKAVSAIQARTFACSYDGRPAGLVFDLHLGISCYDIPTKRYIWQYAFSELESSSDDGKMRMQFVFKSADKQHQQPHLDGVINTEVSSFSTMTHESSDVKDIECDQVQTLVFTLHAFYVTKIMGVDPEFLQNLPLS